MVDTIDDRDDGGKTVLSWASYYGHTQVAKMLLARGPDPMVAENNGRTAMNIANLQRHEGCLEVLKVNSKTVVIVVVVLVVVVVAVVVATAAAAVVIVVRCYAAG